MSEQPIAWECIDERHEYRYIKGIVTTRPETIKAWQEGGIEFVELVRRSEGEDRIASIFNEAQLKRANEEIAKLRERIAQLQSPAESGIKDISDVELLHAATEAWTEETDVLWSTDGLLAAVCAVRDAVEAAPLRSQPEMDVKDLAITTARHGLAELFAENEQLRAQVEQLSTSRYEEGYSNGYDDGFRAGQLTEQDIQKREE